jgi:6-hydroxycyclohex-1-ene-1-carbonyl-CoA dehydrogenase
VLEVKEVETPDPGPGEILVKVAACGLCHTDVGYIDHGVPTFKKPPLILGHEISGTVSALGDGVKGFEEGDRVLLPAVLTCGTCEFCRIGKENICANMVMFGNHIDGGYAEFVKAPAKDTFHLPEEIPLEEGAIIADAVSTPYHAVKNRGQVRPGDKVVVIGCGGVGINLVQVAASTGASVVAVDVVDEKLEKAKELGAVEAINATGEEKLHKKIIKLLGGGADVVFEVIGNPKTLDLGFKATRTGGRLVVVGYTHLDVPFNAGRIMFREMEIVGSLGCRPVDYPKIIEMARIGMIKVEPIVTRKFGLDEINEGFDFLRSGKGFRNLIVP